MMVELGLRTSLGPSRWHKSCEALRTAEKDTTAGQGTLSSADEFSDHQARANALQTRSVTSTEILRRVPCPPGIDADRAHGGRGHLLEAGSRDQNESAWRTQPIQSDRHEPTDSGLGVLPAGSREGVEAVACELVRRRIIPDVAGLCGLGQQVSDHLVDLVLRSGDPLVP